MKSSKLVQLLSTFSAWEMNRLEFLLRSPFFNRKQRAIDLFVFLSANLTHPDALKPRSVFAAVFPGEAYDLQRLRYAMTDLTRLAEEFLIQKRLDTDTGLRDRLLIMAYRSRGLDKFPGQALSKATSRAEKAPAQDGDQLYHQYRLHELALNSNRTVDLAGQTRQLLETLDLVRAFSLSAQLRHTCELVNRHNVISGDWDRNRVAELLKEAADPVFRDLPAVELYRCILLTLLESDQENHYHHLRQLLAAHHQGFSLYEQGQLYAYALNYCIKKLNSGHTGYLRELFSLYPELLRARILYDGNQLLPQHFKNIVTTSIRLEEYQWAARFIEDYHTDLPPEDRENAYLYNQAALSFAKADYGRTLRLLRQVEFTDVFYQLDSKALLLKTYYELDDFEPLLSLIDSFKTYLRRNKVLSDYQRRVYLNLVKFVKKLVQIRLGGRKTMKALKAEIESTQEVADLRWLLGKVGEW